jgi:hypothetical protein
VSTGFDDAPLLGHLGLDESDNDHDDGTADPAASNVGKNRGQVDGTRARSAGATGQYHVQKVTTDATADNSGDWVANGAQVELAKKCTRDIATNGTTN